VAKKTDTVIRLPVVMARCGLRKTSIYLGIREGTFPAPVALGARAVAWRDCDIEAWLAARQPAHRPGRRPSRRSATQGETAP
jgi:prophage regulatory protein